MNDRRSILLILICCTLWVSSVFRTDAQADTGQPKAVLPEVQYEFEPVPEGTQIHHDLNIQNKGTAPLNIEKVRTG